MRTKDWIDKLATLKDMVIDKDHEFDHDLVDEFCRDLVREAPIEKIKKAFKK